jgi:hypothetical protein
MVEVSIYSDPGKSYGSSNEIHQAGGQMSARKSLARPRPRTDRKIESVTVKDFVDDYIYRIDLDADYQREKIWSREDQEELIDSLIQNIDIPKIYLATVPNNESFDFECIDGKQRIASMLAFFKPDPKVSDPLSVRVAGDRFTFKQLQAEIPQLAYKLENFELTLVVYPPLEDELIKLIFRRLQLGVRLNSGELLKTYSGTVRDFVFKTMGKDCPFLRNTNLSEKRFSRQFTLSQICINSFSRTESGDFVRARYDDLADFFKEKSALSKNDSNLRRIDRVLKLMDRGFGESAKIISSRAVAVSAYLFCEQLVRNGRAERISKFAKFYARLLGDIQRNLELLAAYKRPRNSTILEEFQKYISQASVEPYSIRRRHEFLERKFKLAMRGRPH